MRVLFGQRLEAFGGLALRRALGHDMAEPDDDGRLRARGQAGGEQEDEQQCGRQRFAPHDMLGLICGICILNSAAWPGHCGYP
jgi:hypothetical protein